MFLGIITVIFACFVWGLIFLVPEMMRDFSSVEVTLGRYFFYGLFSLLLLLGKGSNLWKNFSLKMYLTAFIFALFGQLGYYLPLVLGIHYANASVTALILGLCPITIAFYGSWQQGGGGDFRRLVVPSILIAFGLVLVNLPAFQGDDIASVGKYLFGLLAAFVSLVSWTWYAVVNARWMKKHPLLAPSDWSTLVGVGTLFWVLLSAALLFVLPGNFIAVERYDLAFVMGGVVLGVLCSWFGFYLWNRGTAALPVSLAGQLMIFETVFGLIFVYCYEKRLPHAAELIGMTVMLIGIAVSIRLFKTREPETIA